MKYATNNEDDFPLTWIKLAAATANIREWLQLQKTEQFPSKTQQTRHDGKPEQDKDKDPNDDGEHIKSALLPP